MYANPIVNIAPNTNINKIDKPVFIAHTFELKQNMEA